MVVVKIYLHSASTISLVIMLTNCHTNKIRYVSDDSELLDGLVVKAFKNCNKVCTCI